MKFSIPFLATEIQQLPIPGMFDNEAVEAIIFNRKDLEPHSWSIVWKSIKHAISLYGADNVSFHFPVNDSDYVKDSFIREKVLEGLQRATDLGLHGMVVHSNQVEPLPWINVDLNMRRRQVVDALVQIREKVQGDTWIALENMPVMDNFGIEIDPLFIFPNDFHYLMHTNVKVIWDICHYTNSLANIAQVLKGEQQKLYYPNVQEAGVLDFLKIKPQIAHWHFSAFTGIANPDTGTHCIEGIIPAKSTLGETLYRNILQEIINLSLPNEHMVFEIKEENYLNRIEIKEMISWAKLCTETYTSPLLP